MDRRLIPVAVLSAAILAGCGPDNHYTPTEYENLLIRTEKEADTYYTMARTSLAIYYVDDECKTEYRGTIDLKEPFLATGIPVAQPSLLVFNFNIYDVPTYDSVTKNDSNVANGTLFGTQSFEIESTNWVSYRTTTLLTPLPGRDYEVHVRYFDNIHEVVIRETDRYSRATQQVSPRQLKDCAVG